MSSHQKLKIQLWASSKKWAFKTIHSLSWCQKFSSSSPWTAPQLRRTFAYYYIKATIAAKAILLLTTPLLPPIHSLQQAKSVCLKGFCISLLASESGYIWWCIHRFYKSWIKIQKKSTAIPRLTWFPTTWFSTTWCFILVPENSYNVILVHKKSHYRNLLWQNYFYVLTSITWFSVNVIFQKKSPSR